MNISPKVLSVAMLSLALMPFAAISQEGDDGAASEKRPEITREERRAAWDNLSEEEKQAKRDQLRSRREEMRAKWESMTPEEREAKKADMQKRMESMTPEQREAMQQRRQQRGQQGGKHKGQGGKKKTGN